MGEMIEFASNGKTCPGYLAGKGAGVIVIQEWWGLVSHIKDVCDRLAAEGFTALAPDLYHGQASKEPTEAGKLMMDLEVEQAAKDLSGAVDHLLSLDAVEPKKVGSVGFCMGGSLSIWLATITPIAACVVYYGGAYKTQPDYSKLKGPVQGHFAETDDWANQEYARNMFAEIEKAGVEADLHIYPGTEHAFFNDSRPEVYVKEAADLSWSRMLDFYRKNLS